MSAATLSTLSIVAFVIAGISLAIAVFLWFFFKIPTVIGDLSGKNAKKSIAKLRATNEKTGNKSYKPSATNQERGKLTETMAGLTSDINHKPKNNVKKRTSKINNKSNEAVTGVLSSNKVNGSLESETTGLLNESEETALLTETLKTPPPERVGGKVLNMLEEIMYIYTDEVIE